MSTSWGISRMRALSVVRVIAGAMERDGSLAVADDWGMKISCPFVPDDFQ